MNLTSVGEPPIITLSRLRRSWGRLRKRLAHDYVRDPVDHIDFEIRAEAFLHEIKNSIMGGRFNPSPTYSLPLAKGKGISRPTLSLDLNDLIVYRVVVETLESRLLKKVPATAFHGGRLLPDPNISDFYERWWENWSKYQAYLKRIKRQGYKTFVVTDIAAYFEQIDLHLLRDMVAQECPGKKQIVDLLFYLLESKTPRNYYARNTFRGLPQENFDCSRELAHFFLHPIDIKLQQWCASNKAKYARWADDFTIAVKQKPAAKQALGELTRYLRELHLTASVEKTSLLHASEIDKHFYFRENQKLDRTQKLLGSKRKRDRTMGKKMVRREYLKFRRKQGGNWKKVLKRFYTCFAMVRSRRLLREAPKHLVEYPDLAEKIFDYLASLRYDPKIAKFIMKHLHSSENLYPGVEAAALEFLLRWPVPAKKRDRRLVSELGKSILFKHGYAPKSEYARGLASLLIYKFGSSTDVEDMGDHYLNSSESDQVLRKYLVAVSLTCQMHDQAERVLAKARLDAGSSVKRLVEFVDCLREAPRLPYPINNKLRLVKIKFSGVLTLQVRRLLIAHLVFRYSPVANSLRRKLIAIRKAVQDASVREKIDSFV